MNLEKASMLETPPSESTAPDDRSTTFQPTEGGTEQRSGATLLVEAYSLIWTLLMFWLVLLWRKQAALNKRLDGLEGAILKASARGPGDMLLPRSSLPPSSPPQRKRPPASSAASLRRSSTPTMTPEHAIFIPGVLLIGMVLGYIIGGRSARAEIDKRRRRMRE
jgi:hypothetical protein